MYYIFILSN